MEISQDFQSATKPIGVFRMTRTELIIYAVISFLVILWCNFKWNRRHFEKIASKMTGPPSYPIIGAGLQFVGTPERKEHNIILNTSSSCDVYRNSFFSFFSISRGHRENH